jgi:hypothetical protein
MSDSKYLELYHQWKNRAIKEGFTFKQFRDAYQEKTKLFVAKVSLASSEDAAFAAKMAYRQLIAQRQDEYKVNKQLETMQWI